MKINKLTHIAILTQNIYKQPATLQHFAILLLGCSFLIETSAACQNPGVNCE